MSLEKRWNLFVTRATALHGGKFDYSQAEFRRQKIKIKIICPDHGEFWQAPDKHISKGSKGCPRCWDDMRQIVSKNIDRSHIKHPHLARETILERMNEKFNHKFAYDFEGYCNTTRSLIKITCPHHGSFYNTVHNHLISGTGCPKCGLEQRNKSKTRNYDVVIKQLQEKHNYLYEYPEYNRGSYYNKKSIIDIICKSHGLFKKKTQKHLGGQGCFQCRVEEMIRENILVGGYSEDLFRNKPEMKDLPAILYYLEINNGDFFKVGITRTSVSNRVSGLRAKSAGEMKDVKIIRSLPSTLYTCFLREQELLNSNSHIRLFKSWSTELFSQDISDQITFDSCQ